jgi:hypothetical protein
LSAISVSNGTLSPAFTPQTTNYTVNVDNSVSQVTITPTVADPTAIVLVNGVSAATPVSLIVGSNTITITVTAQSGAVQKYIVVVNRTASDNCDLSAISLSSGTLNPTFAPQTTNYTVNVDNGVSQITVTPTAADPNAAVLVNGVSATTPVSLVVGSNTITITVTAQSGAVQKYIVVVNRAASDNCNLTAISLSSGGLYPAFTPQTTNYTVNVDNSVTQITITPTAADPNATVMVNGVSATTPVSLIVGSNTITITVTAQSGAVQKYITVVNRAESDNCNLTAISLSSGTLNPTFTSQTTSYTVNVDNSVSQITVTPTMADPTATVLVNGVSAATPVSLIVGSNTITIEVTAQSGAVQKYIIVVNRTASDDCDLSVISISSGTLSPDFTPQTTNYTVNVDNSVTQITVTPTAADTTATVMVNGVSAATPVSLVVGSNTIIITVTAQSGAVQKYIIVVNRTASDNRDLTAISLSSGALNPTFTPQTTKYTLNVDNSVSQITVTPTVTDPTATVMVNGVSAATPVSLIVGSNMITITVTAQSGATQTYTIFVTRAGSINNNVLSGLSISSGTLSPAFTPQTTSYTVNVDNSITQIIVTPTAANTNATVLVNGVSAAMPVYLNSEITPITITVTSQSGSIQIYVILVTRAAGTNCNLTSISLSESTLFPIVNPQVSYYIADVDSSVTQIIVTPIAADPTATVFVNGEAASNPVLLNEGSNTITITVTAQSGAVKKYFIYIKRAYSEHISISAPDSSGNYEAEAPDYVALLDKNDLFCFTLGDVDINIPVSELQESLTTGGGSISKSSPPQSDISQILQCKPSGTDVIDAFTIGLSGEINENNSNDGVTIRLPANDLALLSYGQPEICFYDPAAHTFLKMGAVFDVISGTATFQTCNLGTFVILLRNPTDISYNYTVAAGSFFSDSGTNKSFSVTVTNGSASPELFGGQMMVVTTLSSGNQTFSFFELSGDVTTFTVTVDSNAVKSSVYLIQGGFSGEKIPATYANTIFVT